MVLLLLFLIALAITAFSSGCETAFSAASRIRAYSRLREGKKWAALTLDFIENHRKHLTTTLVGTNVGMVLASSITSEVAGRTGISWVEPVAVTVLAFFILIFTEMIPKQLMLITREHVVSALSLPLLLFRILLYPVILIADFLSSLIVGRRMESLLFESKSEILGLLSDSSSDVGPIAERVLRMNDIRAGNIMRGIHEVPGIIAGASKETIMERMIDSGCPFVLVRESDGSSLRGYADRATIARSRRALDDSGIEGLPYCEADDDLISVITGLRKASAPVAIVMGRTGQPAGIALLDDIVDSLLGQTGSGSTEVREQCGRIVWTDEGAAAE